MRITDHMTNEMASRTGIPINMNSTKSTSRNALLDALDRKRADDVFSDTHNMDSRNTKELKDAADKLIDITGIFDTDNRKEKIYTNAKNNNDLSEIIEKTKNMANEYNSVLKKLGDNDGALYEMYRSEMVNASKEQKSAFEKIGISVKDNGEISVDEEKMKTIEIDDYKDIMDIFAHKIHFLAGRISANASASEESISSRYDAVGNMLLQGRSSFDYFG